MTQETCPGADKPVIGVDDMGWSDCRGIGTADKPTEESDFSNIYGDFPALTRDRRHPREKGLARRLEAVYIPVWSRALWNHPVEGE